MLISPKNMAEVCKKMPTDTLLLNTSGLLCLFDKEDFRHAKATQIFNQRGNLITTNYVLSEFIPLSYVRGFKREDSLHFLLDLCNLPRLEIIWVQNIIHAQAMNLLAKRLDKNYSLCDAVSFVVMRERQIIEALTTDKHFEQEGFIKLLES